MTTMVSQEFVRAMATPKFSVFGYVKMAFNEEIFVSSFKFEVIFFAF